MSREHYFLLQNANLQRTPKIFILNKNGTNNLAQEQQKSKENTDKFVTHTLLAESLFHNTPISCQI